jgi:hypothetical protein
VDKGLKAFSTDGNASTELTSVARVLGIDEGI